MECLLLLVWGKIGRKRSKQAEAALDASYVARGPPISIEVSIATTRKGLRPARSATTVAALPDGASKVKKQISSSGT